MSKNTAYVLYSPPLNDGNNKMIYLTQGILLGFYAAFSPGPFQAFLFSQTLRIGWKRTLPAAFAPLFSDGPIIALFLFILSESPSLVVNTLRLVGGFFLLYLAWEAYRTTKIHLEKSDLSTNPADASLIKAILMNFFNPNVYIFWGTIGATIVLSGWEQSPMAGWSFLIGFYLTIIPSLALLITLFGTAGRLDEKFRRRIGILLAAVLFGFGIYQIWQGLLILLK